MTDEMLKEFVEKASNPEDKPKGEGWMTFHEFKDKLKEAGMKHGEVFVRKVIHENNFERYDGQERNPKTNRLQNQFWYRPRIEKYGNLKDE